MITIQKIIPKLFFQIIDVTNTQPFLWIHIILFTMRSWQHFYVLIEWPNTRTTYPCLIPFQHRFRFATTIITFSSSFLPYLHQGVSALTCSLPCKVWIQANILLILLLLFPIFPMLTVYEFLPSTKEFQLQHVHCHAKYESRPAFF